MVVRHPNDEPSDLIRSVSRALRVLEAVGQTSRGLTVKQVARRCELTTATTYHLIRTLAYEGYVTRRDDGTYTVGLEVADRFRELVAAFRAPATVLGVLHRASSDTGLSHYLGAFVGGQVVITSMVEGARSPFLEDLVPGFDEGAHATALGKALLATLSAEQRLRYLKEQGMRMYTSMTLTEPEALDVDLAVGEQKGLHTEVSQFRDGIGCAAVLVHGDRDQERRIVLACAMPADDLVTRVDDVHEHLVRTSRSVNTALARSGAIA
jgi:DNA-binding IclR family transcriptional regulator